MIFWYSRRSAWARRDQTAGPLLRFSSRYWMQARSAARAISPPRASSSRTRWPFPVPPMAGLQGILPTASRFRVKHRVRMPSRAAARAASMPAWPAPMTAISYCPASNSLIYLYPYDSIRISICVRKGPFSALLQCQHRDLWPVEQTEAGPGVAQAPGSKEGAAVFLIESGSVGGEKGAVGADEAVGEGQADHTAVAVARDHQIGPQETVLAEEAVVAVSQKDPEGILRRGLHLVGQLLRGFLIGVAVGIVNPCQDHGVPFPLQSDEAVVQHRDPCRLQGVLQIRYIRQGP